jgi:hypothetical protein
MNHSISLLKKSFKLLQLLLRKFQIIPIFGFE